MVIDFVSELYEELAKAEKFYRRKRKEFVNEFIKLQVQTFEKLQEEYVQPLLLEVKKSVSEEEDACQLLKKKTQKIKRKEIFIHPVTQKQFNSEALYK